MEYASGASGINPIYFQQAQNQGRNALNTPVAPTLSSAISKIDGINNRLGEAIKQLQSIHDQIGGPRGVGDDSAKGAPEQSGVVHRLNGSADRAHTQLGELEGLISLIARSLG